MVAQCLGYCEPPGSIVAEPYYDGTIPRQTQHTRANERGPSGRLARCARRTCSVSVARAEADRPALLGHGSIAQFEIKWDVQLVDCSRDQFEPLRRLNYLLKTKSWTPEDIEKAVWSESTMPSLNQRCSPTTAWIMWQHKYWQRAFKRNGFSGVGHKSSYGEKGSNVVLFDVSGADLNQLCSASVDAMDNTTSRHDQSFSPRKALSGIL